MASAVRYVALVSVAYLVIGVVYATARMIQLDVLIPQDEFDPGPAPPWAGPLSFLVWFVLPALLWPFNLAHLAGAGPLFLLFAVAAIAPLVLDPRLRRRMHRGTRQ